MIFKFIIGYKHQEYVPILGILRKRLREALDVSLNDVDENDLTRMVTIGFERKQPKNTNVTPLVILGFSLQLTEEKFFSREVVDEFSRNLMTDPIKHNAGRAGWHY